MTPIPLTILTGFLGAGKTSLLNHILRADHGLKIAVLVNDFGTINIDAQLIASAAGETVSLSNGCICCTIREDLLTETQRLVQRQPDTDLILVEASGIADPHALIRTFHAPQIRDSVMVSSVITMVDAEHFQMLNADENRLALAQVVAADLLILNKIDVVTQERLAQARAEIQRWVPQARLIETTQGRAPLELILTVGHYDLERIVNASYEPHPEFETWHWSSEKPLSVESLYALFEVLPTEIFRAKGIVYLADRPERRGILQMVGRRAALTTDHIWEETPHSHIVLIGARGSIQPENLAKHLCACEVADMRAFKPSRLIGSGP